MRPTRDQNPYPRLAGVVILGVLLGCIILALLIEALRAWLP
jgi:hypothetical protein